MCVAHAGQVKPSDRTDRHSAAVLLLSTLLLRNPLIPLVCYEATDQERDDLIGWGPEALFSEHPTDTRNRPPTLGAGDVPALVWRAASWPPG